MLVVAKVNILPSWEFIETLKMEINEWYGYVLTNRMSFKKISRGWVFFKNKKII